MVKESNLFKFEDGLMYSLERIYKTQEHFKVVKVDTENATNKIFDVYCDNRETFKNLILSWNRPAFYEDSKYVFRAMNGENDYDNNQHYEDVIDYKDEVLRDW